MAVYTDLSKEDVIEAMKGYDIGEYISHKGIAQGFENSNFKLHTTKGKYVLTVFEGRVRKRDLSFFMQLMRYLDVGGVIVSSPIIDGEWQPIIDFKGKQAVIVNYIPGKHIYPSKITTDHCEQVGGELAKIHSANLELDDYLGIFVPRYRYGLGFLVKNTPQVLSQAEKCMPGLSKQMLEALEIIKAKWPKDLPKGIIHGDLFPDNVLFDGDRLSAVLDFYAAGRDALMYDFAIAVNAWGFNDKGGFEKDTCAALYQAYNNVRPISEAEYKALPLLCMAAALRFLITRLRDNHPNPMEYANKFLFHRQMNEKQ